MASAHRHERGYWIGEYRCDGSCRTSRSCKGHRDGLSKDPSGKRFTSKRAAEKAAILREHAVRTNGLPSAENSSATLAEIAELWFSSNRAGVMPTTVKGYRDSFRAITAHTRKHERFPWLAEKPVNLITTADIDRVMMGLRKQGLSKSALDNYFKPLNGMLAFAVQKSIIPVNPCDNATRLDSLQGKAREIEPFTEEELVSMAAAMDPRYQMLVLLGGYSGPRIGELFGLHVSDIAFDNTGQPISLHIERQINREGEYAPTKTKKARLTPVAPHIRPLLLDHLVKYSDPNGLVFPAPRGGPLEYHNFRRRYWRPALERVGLTHRGIHSMRHHFATYALDRGIPVEVVTDWGGWSSTAMVYEIYRGKHRVSDIDRYAHLMASPIGVTQTPEGLLEQGGYALSGVVTATVDSLTGETVITDAFHPAWTPEAIAL